MADEMNPRIPKLKRCSFCGKTSEQVRRLVAGPNVHICDECIKLCYDIIADDVTPMSTAAPDSPSLPLPSEMKAVLDEYVIGQDCRGCTACVKSCPVGAITGEPKAVHQINRDKCIKCGACMAKCRFGAISRQ